MLFPDLKILRRISFSLRRISELVPICTTLERESESAMSIHGHNRSHLRRGLMTEARRGKVYTIILQPETNPAFQGYYNASVPALPGCFSYGATRDEALGNIKEAIELCLEDLRASPELDPSLEPDLS